jgi:hypothetical protein
VIEVRGRQSDDADDWLYGKLKLDRPLSGPNWARAWWWCVRPELSAPMQALGDHMMPDELPRWINRQARRDGFMLSARRRLLDAMGLNGKLLELARCLSHDGIVDSAHYQLVWQHPTAARQRLGEAPLLWPLYDVVRMAPTRELGELKARLHGAELGRGGWRLLCRHGPALWWPLRRCHEFRRGAEREIVFLANLLAAVGRHDLPPAALTLALGRVASVNRLPVEQARSLLQPFRAAWRHMDSLPVAERAAWAAGPVQDVLSEWLFHGGPGKVPRNAPWGWFASWAERARRQAYDQTVAVPSFGSHRFFADVEIFPLRHLRAIREAGFALRNCMGRAEDNLQWWETAYFLVCGRDGRVLAMFSVDNEGEHDEVLEIRGRYNREPPPHLLGYVRQYLELERNVACLPNANQSRAH